MTSYNMNTLQIKGLSYRIESYYDVGIASTQLSKWRWHSWRLSVNCANSANNENSADGSNNLPFCVTGGMM